MPGTNAFLLAKVGASPLLQWFTFSLAPCLPLQQTPPSWVYSAHLSWLQFFTFEPCTMYTPPLWTYLVSAPLVATMSDLHLCPTPSALLEDMWRTITSPRTDRTYWQGGKSWQGTDLQMGAHQSNQLMGAPGVWGFIRLCNWWARA
jgi:hypothetical protein